jgi:hypothetical protein
MRQMSLFAGHTVAVLLGMTVFYTDVTAQTSTTSRK